MHTHATYVLRRETSIPMRASRIRDILNKIFRFCLGVFRSCSKYTCCALRGGMDAMNSPVLRNSLSAATLLSAVKHMNKDAQEALYQGLEAMMPDDPAELEEMYQADRFQSYVFRLRCSYNHSSSMDLAKYMIIAYSGPIIYLGSLKP